jgi:hypothetical protein
LGTSLGFGAAWRACGAGALPCLTSVAERVWGRAATESNSPIISKLYIMYRNFILYRILDYRIYSIYINLCYIYENSILHACHTAAVPRIYRKFSVCTFGSGSLIIPVLLLTKTGLFGQPDPKVHIWPAWRIEFSYKDVRDYYTRGSGKGRVRGAVARTRPFNRA